VNLLKDGGRACARRDQAGRSVRGRRGPRVKAAALGAKIAAAKAAPLRRARGGAGRRRHPAHRRGGRRRLARPQGAEAALSAPKDRRARFWRTHRCRWRGSGDDPTALRDRGIVRLPLSGDCDPCDQHGSRERPIPGAVALRRCEKNRRYSRLRHKSPTPRCSEATTLGRPRDPHQAAALLLRARVPSGPGRDPSLSV
jgi:hypothetical protein